MKLSIAPFCLAFCHWSYKKCIYTELTFFKYAIEPVLMYYFSDLDKIMALLKGT